MVYIMQVIYYSSNVIYSFKRCESILSNIKKNLLNKLELAMKELDER
jgi:hypothetical protein